MTVKFLVKIDDLAPIDIYQVLSAFKQDSSPLPDEFLEFYKTLKSHYEITPPSTPSSNGFDTF